MARLGAERHAAARPERRASRHLRHRQLLASLRSRDLRAGRADTGIATRSVAKSAGLDFVPVVWEPFDLLMRQRDYFHPPLQALMRFLQSDELTARAKEMSGFDLSDAGKVRFVV